MNLRPIEKISVLTKGAFEEKYLTPGHPVVFTDLTADWPARQTWTLELFKAQYGDLKVPVYSRNYSMPGKAYMLPDRMMRFGEYLDLLARPEPCDMRLFLFNIFKHAPHLKRDYSVPDIMDGFFNDFPFMFFGGMGSRVALHYDIDMSHVFLNQIYGRKRVVLFAPDQRRRIYQHPFTVAGHIDINHPDYNKHPAQKYAQGFDIMLYPGETLFIPAGYWQYIECTEGGYSLSLRANESIMRRAKGLINIAKHYLVDRSMNHLLGDKWLDIKKKLAERNGEKEIAGQGLHLSQTN